MKPISQNKALFLSANQTPKSKEEKDKDAQLAARMMGEAWLVHQHAIRENPLVYLDNLMDFVVQIWRPTRTDLQKMFCGLSIEVPSETIMSMLDMKFGKSGRPLVR